MSPIAENLRLFCGACWTVCLLRINGLTMRLLAVTCGLATLEAGFFLLPVWFDATGFDPGRWLGAALGIHAGVAMVGRVLAPGLLDKIGLRRGVVGGFCVLAAAAFFFLSVHPGVGAFLAARAVYGAGQTLFLVALLSFQVAAFDVAERSQAMTIVSLGNVLPMLTALPLFELLLARGLVRWYEFFLMAVAGATVWAAFRLPELPDLSAGTELQGQERAPRGSFAQVFREPALRRLFVVLGTFTTLDALQVPLVFVAREQGLPVSSFMVTSALASVLMRSLGVSTVGRFPRRTLAALPGLFLAVALAGATWAGNLFFMALCGALYGAAMGLGYPMMLSLLGDLSSPSLRTRVVSVHGLIYSASYFAVPIAVTALARSMSYVTVYRLASGALVAVGLLAWRIVARHPLEAVDSGKVS